MKNLDLSGIDPLCWAETRARVVTIGSYIAIKHPNATEMLAGSVGHRCALLRSCTSLSVLRRARAIIAEGVVDYRLLELRSHLSGAHSHLCEPSVSTSQL
jgi:hypothetical protein